MYPEADFKATNTELLKQAGGSHAPPIAVLTAVIDAVGGKPEACALKVDFATGFTQWDVVAIRGDVIATVRGWKGVESWSGGTRTEEEGEEASVTSIARRISHIRSIVAEGVTAEAQYDGSARSMRAVWRICFDDGKEIELDDLKSDRIETGLLARTITSRFTGAEPTA